MTILLVVMALSFALDPPLLPCLMQNLVNHEILPIWLYVGYILSNHGVATDPNKIGTIFLLPIPTIVIEYVGHIGYHRRFIFRYSLLLHQ